ncbi:unnamed protein product, partial [Rotaria sp. Silwood1]
VVKYSLTLPMAYLANMLYRSTLIHHSSTTCPFTMTRYLIVIADFLMANTIDIQLCILAELLSRFRSCLGEHALLAETLSIFGIIEIDQIAFDQIERCVAILNIELNHDKLFDEMIHIQSTFKEIVSYRESLSDQIQTYIGNCNFDEVEETTEKERFFHKTTTSNHQHNHPRIRPDQFWASLISRTTTNCQEITKLISFIYSIPCSNAFTEGVFNHMKQAWTPSRNLMSVETIAAKLQIRFNDQMKCDVFFLYVQNEPELIQYARRTEKYNFRKKH